jgi:hypothetical protein
MFLIILLIYLFSKIAKCAHAHVHAAIQYTKIACKGTIKKAHMQVFDEKVYFLKPKSAYEPPKATAVSRK